MRAFASRVELLAPSGDHLRFVPSEFARAMISVGHAEIAHANGKVKSVRLVATASTHLVRIGEPSGGWLAPRYSVREKLDSGHVLWKHHPRCTHE